MDDKGLSRLLKQILIERGIDLSQYRSSFLERRLRIRLGKLGIDSYDGYGLFLSRHREEYENLLQILSINVTEFFRDPKTFEGFQSTILPLLTRQSLGRRLRIWSAGCASGEEPYSIAIVIAEFLQKEWEKWKIDILATDVDMKALERAGAGRYPRAALQKISEERKRRFFREGDGSYDVIPSLRSWVRFERKDLLDCRPLSGLDVIFCRNVLIYLDIPMQIKLFHTFHDSLQEGGYLILGNLEIMLREGLSLFRPVDVERRTYQRI